MSKRGRPLTKSVHARRAEAWPATKGASVSGPQTRGRPPLSRQASRHRASLQDLDSSPDFATVLSPAISPMEEEEEDHAGPSNAGFDDAFEHDKQQRKGPVDLLAAAAATLAGCKKDKQGLLPMWGHKGRRSQGHDGSPLGEEPDYEVPRVNVPGSGAQGEQSTMQSRAEATGRNLRPRSAKRPRSS